MTHPNALELCPHAARMIIAERYPGGTAMACFYRICTEMMVGASILSEQTGGSVGPDAFPVEYYQALAEFGLGRGQWEVDQAHKDCADFAGKIVTQLSAQHPTEGRA